MTDRARDRLVSGAAWDDFCETLKTAGRVIEAFGDACDRKMLPPNSGDYERVAVIGAGVSGLTVAHDLTRVGYKVTVFEAYSEPGGMRQR